MSEIEEMNNVLREWAEDVIVKIQDNLDTTGTTASGKTKESLRYELETDEYGGKLTIYGRQYFQGVEEGRPAGGIPYKFQDIIRQWMSDKKIENQFGEKEWQKRNAAYLIAQKIKDSGTMLYREGGITTIYTDTITEMLPELKEKMGVILRESILRDI